MSGPQKVIVVGTSAGGLSALCWLLDGLPADIPATVLVVMHVGPFESALPQLLSPHTSLPIRHALDFDKLEQGHILVAPPDSHMRVENSQVRLFGGPKENFSRPAIDPLFRSAAMAYREHTIGVVLNGDLDDGAVGLVAIKAYGGKTLVQDPSEASAPSMPMSALQQVDVDFCLPVSQLSQKLVELAREPSTTYLDVPPSWIGVEEQLLEQAPIGLALLDEFAERSEFVCPECHGGLWEMKGSGPLHFRCHTGHAYSATLLATLQNQMTEEAAWAAIRALTEKAMLHQRLADISKKNGNAKANIEYEQMASQAYEHAEALKNMISRIANTTVDPTLSAPPYDGAVTTAATKG